MGTPYVWGGNQPGGFDCSGLVQYAYGLGSNYRTTYQQTNLGAHHSDIQNAQSGDLYFWGPDSAPYHVAIATGNGSYIQAPTPGQNVQTGNINYYTPSFYISMN
ncbi:MAG: C40 family peptidase [Limosilactobacillus reuteri]|nr:C40 family peptidase [Limosilactobacillus reuteri]